MIVHPSDEGREKDHKSGNAEQAVNGEQNRLGCGRRCPFWSGSAEHRCMERYQQCPRHKHGTKHQKILAPCSAAPEIEKPLECESVTKHLPLPDARLDRLRDGSTDFDC